MEWSVAYLLEVGREAVHVLIVGQDGVRLGAKEVVVPVSHSGGIRVVMSGIRGMRIVARLHIPHAKYGESDGQVLLNGRGAEVLVHLVSTGEQLFKVLKTWPQRN
jgi:hypothetical protein